MKKTYLFLLILLGVHLFLLVNLKFTAWPEMLSYPYLRNNGYLLYKDMIHPYPPVLTMALSIIYEAFGYKLIALKVFTWLIVLANDVLIYLIAKKLTKKNVFALASLTLYVFIQPFLEGNQLWFDLAAVPFILLGALLLLHKRYFLSGLSLGVAILTKQTTGLFLILWGTFLLIRERNIKGVFNLIAGPAILFIILLIRLFTEGAILGFLNWTLIYPLTWWSKFPGYVQMVLTKREIATLGLLSTLPLLVIVKLKNKLLKDSNLLLLILSIFVSSILVYPRFSFFHLQIALPFISIVFGLTLSKFDKSKFLYILSPLYFLPIMLLVIKPGFRDWGKEARFWGEEEEKMAQVINNKTKTGDLVYLLGLQSGLYVFSGRLPPKPWTDNYVWYLEIPGIQEEIVERWEGNKPVVVFTNNIQEGNWYDLGTYRPQKIVDWIRREKIKVWNIED